MHRRSLFTAAALMGAALFASALLAASSASAGQSKWDYWSFGDTGFNLDGLYITVSSFSEVTQIITWNESGGVERDFRHVVEQDVFTANGKTLVSEPYTYNLEIVYRDGQVAESSSGLCVRVPLPDGTKFTSAGRIDLALHPYESYLLLADVGGCSNLEGFIAALSP